jgi:hypothetical protein
MNPVNQDTVSFYIIEKIGPLFYDKKKSKISKLSLNSILKRKNPYLFKAKGCQRASDFIKNVIDATLSSGEETVFGNFLESLAIFVAGQAYGGRKSTATGIDLEFETHDTKYLVSIKSGPDWGNSSQQERLKVHFAKAQRIFRTSGGADGKHLRCIEGCCYGPQNVEKDGHTKLCGQAFWSLVSGGSETLYQDIIVPLGHSARRNNADLDALIDAKMNTLTHEFVERFCLPDGTIDWDRLVAFNSGRTARAAD